MYLYVPTTRALVTPFLTHVTCTCTCACTVRVYSLVSLSLSPAWEERTPLSLSSLSLAGWLPGGSALCRHPPSLTPTHETALVPVEAPSRAPAHSAMLSVPPRDAGRARDSGRRPPPIHVQIRRWGPAAQSSSHVAGWASPEEQPRAHLRREPAAAARQRRRRAARQARRWRSGGRAAYRAGALGGLAPSAAGGR